MIEFPIELIFFFSILSVCAVIGVTSCVIDTIINVKIISTGKNKLNYKNLINKWGETLQI